MDNKYFYNDGELMYFKSLKNNTLLLSVLVLLPLYSPLILADSINPAFSAVCKESSARTYSASYFEGRKNDDAWTKIGAAESKEWQFNYKGGDKLVLDGKEIPIIEQHKGVLIAMSHESIGVGSTAWLYVVHLGLGRVAASVVNAHGHMNKKHSGILTASMEFKCNFDPD